MGDWRTLHFFNEEKYKEEIVPQVTDIESYLSAFLNDYRLNWVDGYPITREEILRNTITFVSELSSELNIHPYLIEIEKRKAQETYHDFVKRRNQDFDHFFKSKLSVIEFFEFLLIETIFSSVANFNPHFKLGKRLFESLISAKKGSVAEELIRLITTGPNGAVLDLVDGGIMNWLNKEEVELLYLDNENLICQDDKYPGYVNEFKEFLFMAVNSDCGLISLRNPSEYRLSRLQSKPNENEIQVKESGFKNILINRK